MLDPAGLAPTAAPRPHVLSALREDLTQRRVRLVLCDEVDRTHPSDGPGLRAESNGSGGYHVGRRTLVSFNGGAAVTFERFCLDRNGLTKGEKRILLADLIACGSHTDPASGLIVRVMATVEADVSDARMAAEAELARLDAIICHLAEARRRYAADTACNAWTLEHAARDVARTADAAAKAFAARAELA